MADLLEGRLTDMVERALLNAARSPETWKEFQRVHWAQMGRVCRECNEPAIIGVPAKIGGDPIMWWLCQEHFTTWCGEFEKCPVGTTVTVIDQGAGPVTIVRTDDTVTYDYAAAREALRSFRED